MAYNLIYERWIPVQRRGGGLLRIAPWEMSDPGSGDGDPIVRVASGRPDFSGALTQLLIGLVQTAFAPQDSSEWRKRLKTPPTPETLRETFEAVAGAFVLDGDGARFMQDLTLAEDEREPLGVAALLIDNSGDGTFFVKPGQVKGLCFPCAATALFTLQTNAPAGGVGHRTSLRGGGPLTTLVLGQTLWQTVWLNVLEGPAFERTYNEDSARRFAQVDQFPWLAPTRTSEKGKVPVGPLDVHPAQMFWGMPRRIRLVLSGLEPGACDICGQESEALLSGYVTRNYGINYEGPWQHPLTPYNVQKDGTLLSRKGQPGCLLYRHWPAYTLGESDGRQARQPARVVQAYQTMERQRAARAAGLSPQSRLWAFGYDMDNMKARCWYEAAMPLITVDEGIATAYRTLLQALIAGAALVAWNTRIAIKQALFDPGRTIRGDLTFIEDRFWQMTESDFVQTMFDLIEVAALPRADLDITAGVPLKVTWLKVLTRASEALFDELSQIDQLESTDPKRVIEALRWLRWANSTANKKMIACLGLPAPEKNEEKNEEKKGGKKPRSKK